ncbi:MAG TPA: DUF2125 domain-containing protein [Acetobacteraceae bacterium]|jgi:hypothetical protein
MRRWLWIVMLAVAILLAEDAALWRYATRQLQTGLDQWVAAQRAAGWTVKAGEPRTGGWPLAATLTVPDVAIDGAPRLVPHGVSWSAHRVVLRVSLLHPAILQIEAPGTGRLRVGSGAGVPYAARRLAVAVPLQSDGPPPVLDLRAEHLAIDLPNRPVTVERLTAHVQVSPAAKQAQSAIAVTLRATGVGLPPAMHWALGPRIASLALDAALDGPLPVEGGPTERATTWRNDGGVLEVGRLDTAWGPLRLRANARLDLDAGLQPTGSGDARIAGYDATADALAAHGIMAPSAAIAAKAVLSLLAHAPDDGGPSEVDVPLTLRKRTLSMQRIPLLRFPELDWPAE